MSAPFAANILCWTFFFEPPASKKPKEMNDGIPIRRWCGAVVSVYLYSNQIRSFRTDFLSIVRNRRHLEKILSWFLFGITAFFSNPSNGILFLVCTWIFIYLFFFPHTPCIPMNLPTSHITIKLQDDRHCLLDVSKGWCISHTYRQRRENKKEYDRIRNVGVTQINELKAVGSVYLRWQNSW